jgi:small subunit ribosomal protein S20
VNNLCDPSSRWALTPSFGGANSQRPFAGLFRLFLESNAVANTQSSEKRNRQAQKHRARNQRVISAVRTQVKKLRDAAAKGDAAKTKEELVEAVRAIAKAASKGVIHKAQASRRIARLTKSANAPAPAAKQ